MPRAQNAHAYVNAAFMVKVNKKNSYTVVEKPTVLFGGINPKFVSIFVLNCCNLIIKLNKFLLIVKRQQIR